jgi:hypothetical protein
MAKMVLGLQKPKGLGERRMERMIDFLSFFFFFF